MAREHCRHYRGIVSTDTGRYVECEAGVGVRFQRFSCPDLPCDGGRMTCAEKEAGRDALD